MEAPEQPLARFKVDYPAGEIIFRQGDPGEAMYVVQSGSVRITRTAARGRQTVATLGPGEFFGEMSILTGAPCSATVETAEETTLIRIEAKTFETMLTRHTEIAARMMQTLAARLTIANELVEILSQPDPFNRVVLGLLHRARAKRSGEDVAGPLVLPFDHKAFCAEFCVSGQELGAALNRLADLGAIEPAHENIMVSDIEVLQDLGE